MYDLNELKKYNKLHTECDRINDLRNAAKCHKNVFEFIKNKIKPGLKYIDLANMIENKICEYTKQNNLNAGIAFPTGISVNNIVAHDTPEPNDMRIICDQDVCKIDFGIHYNGHIIDSAFTKIFDIKYTPIVDATRDATSHAIRYMRPDMLCNEISKQIKEIIESYEITLNNKTIPIVPIKDLGGHSIDKYNIHSGKLILCSPCDHALYKHMRINYGQYAIETFATTGTGSFKQKDSINHFMLNSNPPVVKFKSDTTRQIHKWIKNNKNTLPFTQRWICNDLNINSKYRIGINELIGTQTITGYPPLYDIDTSYVSQSEHTIFVHENGTEILTIHNNY